MNPHADITTALIGPAWIAPEVTAVEAAGPALPDTAPAQAPRPEGFMRVAAVLAQAGHAHTPLWLDTAARTSLEAAELLGVHIGQIAKSVIFKRRADAAAVLVVASGDRRVDEKKVAALVGAIGRADVDFVKASTGFSIGGVSPVAQLTAPVVLIDRELFRFEALWAAAGHPNGVFQLAPQELVALTQAPVVDVVMDAAPAAQPAPAPAASP